MLVIKKFKFSAPVLDENPNYMLPFDCIEGHCTDEFFFSSRESLLDDRTLGWQSTWIVDVTEYPLGPVSTISRTPVATCYQVTETQGFVEKIKNK